ncbi:bifunctional (p)ppGpp synthetase/guanosine-3',5'-bis(diphosphate) 3'-pyrophosphohydrolase [Patescibacteria group bacterium]|nr:bifunctional (p)ppGpp synthetase/guanosine-3',5'-bis(diphosphate) 3'-pyrophosphohydrolase [Patescibacteria group bacterium]
MENGAFQILDPKEFNRITNFVEKSYGDVDMYKNKGVDKLLYLCEQEGVSIAKVTGRLKSPYRIYKKLQKYQTSDISKVMDILAFRIIATDLSSCYSIL